MAWTIEYDAAAKRELSKLDKHISRRLTKFMHQRVAELDDPRSIGHGLAGSELGNLWRYRIGDYRIICDIQDVRIVVLVLRIGHRREIYR